jgi:Protein of unknown function (DUF3352)
MFKNLKRISGVLLAVILLPLFLAACGTNTNTNSAGAIQKAKTGYTSPVSDYFPAETSLYITLNTNADSQQTQSFKKITDYLSGIPEVKEALSNIDFIKLANLGTYDADVKTWLSGELAIGLTDLKALLGLAQMATGTSLGQGQGNNNSMADLSALTQGLNSFLIAATIKDQAKAEAFLKKAMGLALAGSGTQIQPTTSTYNGYNLTAYNLFVAELVLATNKDRLFVGTQTSVKAAIDRPKDKSLSNAANYKTVSGKLPSENLGFVYADVNGIVKTLLNDPTIQQMLQTNPASFKAYEFYGGVGVTFATADEGFRVDSYTTYDSTKIPADQLPLYQNSKTDSKIIEALPEKTFFFGNGKNAKQAFDSFMNTLNTAGTSTDEIKQGITEFEQASGLNLQNDIISLLSGEYVFFGTSAPANSNTRALPLDIGLLSTNTDKAATQTKIDKIVAAIENAENSELKFESKTFNGVTYKSAPIAESNMSLNIGIAGNNLFLGSSTAQAEAIITAATGGASYAKSGAFADFNTVKGYLPTDNSGYFYLNLQETLNVALSTATPKQQADVKKVTDKLTQLRSIGGATKTTTSEGVTTFFIHFPVTK